MRGRFVGQYAKGAGGIIRRVMTTGLAPTARSATRAGAGAPDDRAPLGHPRARPHRDTDGRRRWPDAPAASSSPSAAGTPAAPPSSRPTTGSPTSFGSYDALVASPDVDVIYIALPNHLHVPWTIKALEAGKHVLCEKPLALAAHEVDEIAAACERTGRIAVEGFMYLHHPQILRTLEIVRSGVLGPLEVVNGTFSFYLTNEADVRVDPTMGGGSVWDVGCYPVSMARRIAGEEPDRVDGLRAVR